MQMAKLCMKGISFENMVSTSTCTCTHTSALACETALLLFARESETTCAPLRHQHTHIHKIAVNLILLPHNIFVLNLKRTLDYLFLLFPSFSLPSFSNHSLLPPLLPTPPGGNLCSGLYPPSKHNPKSSSTTRHHLHLCCQRSCLLEREPDSLCLSAPHTAVQHYTHQ